jgi:hypothetical protein
MEGQLSDHKCRPLFSHSKNADSGIPILKRVQADNSKLAQRLYSAKQSQAEPFGLGLPADFCPKLLDAPIKAAC